MTFETPAQKTKRQGIEGKVNENYEAGDMFLVDKSLDVYAYGKRRPELTATEMVRLFPRLARFFKEELESRADQDTTEIPIVTPEMLEDAA